MPRPRGAKARAAVVVERLAGEYPGTATELCALVHDNPFQLLVATILSAQCTDEMVNKVTPSVFARYPTPADLAEAPTRPSVEELIHSTGFFRQKTKSLIGMAAALEERFGGEVPTDLDDLVTLPGRRAQDRQRDPLRRVRPPGPARRHARRSARAPPEAHDRGRIP